MDAHSLERVGRDLSIVVSSSVFRSGFPGRPPISHALIDADGLILVFDRQGGLLDPYFAQPGAVQCALNQALTIALARVADAPTVFDSPFAVYDQWTRQAMVRLISKYSLQAVLLLSEAEGLGNVLGDVVDLRSREESRSKCC